MAGDKVKVEFTSSASIDAGTIAVRLMEKLLQTSQFGQITLDVCDGHVVQSELKVRERYKGAIPISGRPEGTGANSKE